MPRPSLSWVLIATLTTLGCSGSDGPSAPAPSAPASPPHAPPAPTASPEGEPARAPEEPSSTSHDERPTPEAVVALREARTLAREERFEDAWQRLEPLVRGGGPASLRCEAGYVAFRAGHLEEAVPLVRGAAEDYPPGEDRESRAALARCLYNVGLVSEAASDLPGAVRAYQRSFSLRANRIVYEHLVQASLRADGALDQAAADRIGAIARRAIGPSTSFEELAAALTEFCGAARFHPRDCTARVEQRWPAPAAAAPILEVALITSVSPGERYLAIRDASGARLLASLEPRFPSPDESRVESLRFEEVLEPAGLEIVLDVLFLANDSYPGGNDCDSEARGCDGATRRRVERHRIVCGTHGAELACAGILTMALQFHAEGMGASLPCDAPAPALPFGVGWVGDAVFDGRGHVTTSARAVASEGVACPGEPEPVENEVSLEDEPLESPPRPLPARTVPVATLFADEQLVLERRFPHAPRPTAPPALAFLRPWSPPRASAADAAPLEELASIVAGSCETEVANDQPRCCPYDGRCSARVAAQLAVETDELAVLEVRCTDVDAYDTLFHVLTRGTVGGEHRAVATLRASYVAPGEQLPPLENLRLEEALPASGLEARVGFRVEVAEPVVDQRTRVDADSRSTTLVEVLCTSGEDGLCWGLPVSYRGRHLAAGDDGRAAVVASTGWRVGFAIEGERFVFTTQDGSPPEPLTGSRLPSELTAYVMRRWATGAPEEFY